jgi:hypothetical protein
MKVYLLHLTRLLNKGNRGVLVSIEVIVTYENTNLRKQFSHKITMDAKWFSFSELPSLLVVQNTCPV